jgi:murein DD-endopeptidase MepM/ murein hydrolase activator NlpD
MTASLLLVLALGGISASAATVVSLWRARVGGVWLALRTIAAAALMLLLIAAVPWEVVSRPLRLVAAAAFVAAAFVAWTRRGRTRDRGLLPSLVMLLVALPLDAAIARGWVHAPPIALRSPYAGTGKLVAIQAGNNAVTNHFHWSAGQPLAVDFVAVDGWGRRAHRLLPRDNADYVIFGQPVVAACTGEVVAAVDGNADNVPPLPDRVHVSGNYVAIACDGAVALTCHLQSGSVRVRVGQKVAAREPIARAGNSGNSAEPHLHLEVFRGRLDGEKLPFTVDGWFVTTLAP